MKRFRSLVLPLLFAGALVAGVSAAGTLAKSFVLAAPNGAPTATTNCVDLTNHLSHKAVTEVDVTIGDYSDGGTDDDNFISGRGLAWAYDPGMLLPDGGGGFTREPAYDVAFRDLTIDGNPATRSQTAHVVLPTRGIDSAAETRKLCYSTQGVSTDGGSVLDAGAPLVHKVIIRARYEGN